MPPQLWALFTAISYASANVTARRGMIHSTPSTATLLSLIVHTVILWLAVFLTGGIPKFATAAALAIAVTGILQAVIRLCHYTGIDKIGATRAVTLRSTYPILSVIVGITILKEPASTIALMGTLSVVVGIILTSWRLEKQLTSFRWWHLLFPLATAVITGVVHPIRRYAMTITDEPLFLAALVGPISLISFVTYLSLPTTTERLVWNQKALWPFMFASLFETLGILFMLTAFVSGPVVLVSPITATSPIWTVLMAAIFLRDLERINLYSIIGTLCVVVGVISVYLAD
jgi:uncharacterized membrane protein